jgi:hypothetical protein
MKMKITKDRMVQFRVSDREFEMLTQMCDHVGAMPSEFIRSLIRDKHVKMFPIYAQTRKEKLKREIADQVELTPEQACEQMGGTIVNREGIPSCALKMSSTMTRYLPLSKPELFKR